MVKIRPKPNEPLARTLKRFKRLCENEGIMRDYRRHEFYETPSQIKRRKRASNKKNREKEARELEQGESFPTNRPESPRSSSWGSGFDS